MTNLIIYIIGINIISFIIYGIDKLKAIRNVYRVSETTLLTLSILGGSIGSILGMLAFKHKTRKIKFIILNPLLFIIQIYLIILFIYKKYLI